MSGSVVSQYSWFHRTIDVATKQPRLEPHWLPRLGCAAATRLPEQDSQRGTVLEDRLIEEWRRFSQDIIDKATKERRVRLRACVSENGGHFEHKL